MAQSVVYAQGIRPDDSRETQTIYPPYVGSTMVAEETPAGKTFGESFSEARASGASEFEWEGKRYHTRTKEEDAPRTTALQAAGGIKPPEANPAPADFATSLLANPKAKDPIKLSPIGKEAAANFRTGAELPDARRAAADLLRTPLRMDNQGGGPTPAPDPRTQFDKAPITGVGAPTETPYEPRAAEARPRAPAPKLGSAPTLTPQGIPVEQRPQATVSESKYDFEKDDHSIPRRAFDDFRAGVLQSTGAALRTIGRKTEPQHEGKIFETSNALTELGDAMERSGRGLLPNNPTYADEVVHAFGSMASMYVPGVGVMRGAEALSVIAPAGARWVGAGTMAALEAAMESDETYKRMLAKGATIEEASAAADKNFMANAAFVGLTDKISFFSDIGSLGKRVATASVTEAGQEGVQSVLGDYFAQDPIDWSNAGRAASIGAIVGGGTAAVIGGTGGAPVDTGPTVDDYRALAQRELHLTPGQAADAAYQKAKQAHDAIVADENAAPEVKQQAKTALYEAQAERDLAMAEDPTPAPPIPTDTGIPAPAADDVAAPVTPQQETTNETAPAAAIEPQQFTAEDVEAVQEARSRMGAAGEALAPAGSPALLASLNQQPDPAPAGFRNMTPSEAVAAESLANALGFRVAYYASGGRAVSGMFTEGAPGHVMVDTHIQQGDSISPVTTIAHEINHAIEYSHPEVYATLRERVDGLIDDAARVEFFRHYFDGTALASLPDADISALLTPGGLEQLGAAKPKRASALAGLWAEHGHNIYSPADIISREMLADLTANRYTSDGQNFWAGVRQDLQAKHGAEKGDSLFRKMADYVIGAIEKALAAMKGSRFPVDEMVAGKLEEIKQAIREATVEVLSTPARAQAQAQAQAQAAPADAAAEPLASPKLRSSDVGHKREKETGRYVGAPDWVGNNPGKLAVLRAKLRKLAIEGADGRFWYENSSKAILDLAEGDKALAEKIVGLIAIYSPNATVPANTSMALNAFYQWRYGLPIKAGFGPANEKAENLLRHDKAWSGIKTNSFYQNLMAEIDPSKLDEGTATMDMWMAIAFDYGMKALDQGPKYKFAERETQRLAKELGWKPHQVQAAIWVAMKGRVDPIRKQLAAEEDARGWSEYSDDGKQRKIRKEHKADHFHLAHRMGMEHRVSPEELTASAYDFSHAIAERTAQVSWEAKPGRSTGILPGIFGAPIEQQAEYLYAIDDVLHDKDGRDIIATELGLAGGNAIYGPSAWEGEVGAGAQSMFAVNPPAKEKRAGDAKAQFYLKPEQHALLNQYAAIRGYVMNQEAVVWHFPVYNGTAKQDQNGVDVRFGRSLTIPEMDALYREIASVAGHSNWAPANTAEGVRVLNFEGTPNKDFHDKIKLALDNFISANAAVPEYTARPFHSVGDYVGNDWKENANGEGYKSEALGYLATPGWAERPDLLERVEGLRRAVEAVNERFSEKYGWGKPLASPRRSDAAGDRRGGSVRAGTRENSVQVTGVHYSGRWRGTLDSSFYGQGMPGAEARRLDDWSATPEQKHRIYFYVDTGAGVTPESGVGNVPHYAKLDNLYDWVADPLGFWPAAHAKGGSSNDIINRVEQAIMAAGFDGFYQHDAKSLGGNQGVAVLLGERQVKPSEDPSGEIKYESMFAEPLASPRRGGFYSQLAETIEGAKQTAMPGQQWKAWINANAQRAGVKLDEIHWSGVLDYLDLRGKDKVTREELAAFINDNGVQVNETVLGDTGSINPYTDPDELYIQEYTRGNGPDTWRVMYAGEVVDEFDTREEAEALRDEIEADMGERPKYGSYVPPGQWGSDTYREVLVTLPTKEKVPTRHLYQLVAEDGNVIAERASEPPETWRNQVASRNYTIREVNVPDAQAAKREGIAAYTSSHWDQPNVLVHLRLDEIVGPDGGNALRLIEVQSDWGQDGRKNGFTSPEQRKAHDAAQKAVRAYADELAEKHGRNWTNDDLTLDELDKLDDLVQARSEVELDNDAVPAAPFVTDTKAWIALGLKKAIQYAVGAGLDTVVIATGKQNAALYDLSKQVDEVLWDAREGAETGTLIARKGGSNALVKNNIKASELPDHVGKEVAERLLKAKRNDYGMRSLKGVDLEIGGEGMLDFYDRIVPQVAGDVLKKLGGGKLYEITAGVDRSGGDYGINERAIGGFTAWVGKEQANWSSWEDANDWISQRLAVTYKAFDITPTMKEKVLAGMPLFSPRRDIQRIGRANKELPNLLSRKDQARADAVFKALHDEATQRLLDGTPIPADSRVLPMTGMPAVLQMLGAPNQIVAMDTGVLDKLRVQDDSRPGEHGHAVELQPVSAEDFNRIMRDPAMVFLTKKGEFEIVSDRWGDYGPLTMIVMPNATEYGDETKTRFAKVMSVYSRPLVQGKEGGLLARLAAAVRGDGDRALVYFDPARYPAVLGKGVPQTETARNGPHPATRRRPDDISGKRDNLRDLPSTPQTAGARGLEAPSTPEAVLDKIHGRSVKSWLDLVKFIGNRYDGDVAEMPLFSPRRTIADLPEEHRFAMAQLLAKAEATQPAFQQAMQDLAASELAVVLVGPVKTEDSAVRKALNKYKGDPSKLTDMVRATIAVDTPDDIPGAIDAVKKLGKVIELENGWENPEASVDGYLDAQVKVDFNGVTAEIQINTKDMIAAKDAGWPVYAREREVSGLVRRDNREPSPIERIRVNNALRQQRNLYGPAQGVRDALNDAMGNKAQAEWLGREARARGFKNADDLAANKPDVFMRLATKWREGDVQHGSYVPAKLRPVLSNRPDAPVKQAARVLQSRRRAAPVPPEETRAAGARRITGDYMKRFEVLEQWGEQFGVSGNDLSVHSYEIAMPGRVAARVKTFRENTVRDLVKKMQKAGLRSEEVAQYLHARHAAERNAKIAEINPAYPDGGSGMDNATAAQILEEAAKQPNFAALQDIENDIRKIIGDTKQMLLDSGIISQDTANAWEAAYKNYVPLRGGPEDGAQRGAGKGLSVNGKQKRAMGHGVRDEYIIEHVLRGYEQAVHMSERNRVGHTLIRWLKAMNNPNLGTVGEPEQRAVLRPGAKVFEVSYHGSIVAAFSSKQDAYDFINDEALAFGRSPADFTINVSQGDPHVVYMAHPMMGPEEVAVYENGEMIRVQLNDPLLLRAYKKLGNEQMNKVLSAARDFNTFLSAMYTGRNPEFILVNMVRDFLAAPINLTGEYGADVAARALSYYPKALLDMFRYQLTGKATPILDEYMMAGGSTGAAWMTDLERLAKDVGDAYDDYQGALRTMAQGRPAKGAWVAGRKLVKMLTFWIEHLNAATENAMRLAAYEAVKAKTDDGIEAVRAAKQVTVNFNKKGELGAQLGALQLFYNPAIQGGYTIYHALLKGKHKHQAQALLVTLPILGYLMAAAGDGDDDIEAASRYEQSRNIIIPLGDGKRLNIPMPYGYSWFVNMGQYTYELQRDKDLSTFATRAALSFQDNFSPVSLFDTDGFQFAELPLTEPVKMLQRLNANKSSFGSMIVPENSFDPGAPDSGKMFRRTVGSFYDDITSSLNEATGGSLTQPGMIDVSPETLRFWWTSLTGGAGAFVESSISFTRLAASEPGTVEARDVPVLRKFIKDESTAELRARYFEALKKARAADANFKRAWKGEDEKGEMIAEQRSKLANEYLGMLNAQRDALDALAMDRLAIQRDKTLSIGEKRLRLKMIEKDEEDIFRSVLEELPPEMTRR